MLYLVTHGERESKADPGHTINGFLQIQTLCAFLKNLEIASIVVGTGRRFEEIHHIIRSHGLFPNAPVVYSSLIGSTDSRIDAVGDEDAEVVLSSGTRIPAVSFVGLAETQAFEAWKLLREFDSRSQVNTLLCSGRQLIRALTRGKEGERHSRSGAVYQVDPHIEATTLLHSIDVDAGQGAIQPALRVLQQMLNENQYRSRWDLCHPAAYSGPVWVWIVPQPANHDVPHRYSIRWGAWNYSNVLRFGSDEGATLAHMKGDDGFSHPIRIDVTPDCYVRIGQRDPPAPPVYDINYGWKQVMDP